MKDQAVQSGDGQALQRLWAPWRMEYIRLPRQEGCFLCNAFAAGDDRAHLVVYRGELCAVILNRYPYNNGHLMIAPYRHVPDLAAMTREERVEAMELLHRSIQILGELMSPDGFNAGLNLGSCAGAGLVGHIHLHVVPRWNGDTNFMPVIAGTKVIPQSLDELWTRLHPLFSPGPAPDQ